MSQAIALKDDIKLTADITLSDRSKASIQHSAFSF